MSGSPFPVGRIRARYLTVRLPNPPVRTEYAAFTAHGSRNREFMVASISSAIPGEGRPPVTTTISLLAFRKHQCDNTSLTGTLGYFDEGVCHVNRCPQRTPASL